MGLSSAGSRGPKRTAIRSRVASKRSSKPVMMPKKSLAGGASCRPWRRSMAATVAPSAHLREDFPGSADLADLDAEVLADLDRLPRADLPVVHEDRQGLAVVLLEDD